MKFELKLRFNNADSGERDEKVITVSSDADIMVVLASACQDHPSEETFEELFKKMYDNPIMDGVNTGILYNDTWTIMSSWAFDKLGWYDVTVDVLGLVIDGEETDLQKLIEEGMLDYNVWSLQLSRDGFMYCYA